jgi:tetratricopeptide (TPR) repeat protein
MNENEIRNQYLALYSYRAHDPLLRQALLKLDLAAAAAQLPVWQAIIQARIARCDADADTAIRILDTVLAQDPNNTFAQFLKASVLPDDRVTDSLVLLNAICQQLTAGVELNDLQLLAMAMYNKGVALGRIEKPQEALAVYDAMIARFGEAPDLTLRESVAKAMLSKGMTLGRIEKPQEALAVYDALIARYGEAPELTLREQVAKAMVNSGFTLGRMEKPQEALVVYDALIARYGKAPELTLRELVAKAMLNNGVALGQMEKPQEELTVYDALIARYGEAPELTLREQVAKAMFNKGVTLGQMEKPQEALEVYDALIARYGEAPELMLHEQVAKAMVNSGLALGRMEKPQQALVVYDAMIARFGKAPELTLRELVAKAMVNKGLTLGQMEKPQEEALAVYDAMIDRFGRAPEKSLHEMSAKVKSLKAWLLSRTSTPASKQAKQDALDATRGDYGKQLEVYLRCVLEQFPSEQTNKFFEKMKVRQERTDDFIVGASRFNPAESLLFVLREWNSYTPAIPTEEERDRGGGYFIWHKGQGVVIDPGYDFIEAFHRAGGRLCDIHHIVVTHAHDDHTAELESLLMLLHRRATWKSADGNPPSPKPERVSLYLNQGAERKFAGIVPLRDAKHLEKVVVLSRPTPGSVQKITIIEGVELSVLPAYHDDVVTRDTAVGLGFIITCPDGTKRKIVFTGDTGLYPPLLNNGQVQYHDANKTRPKRDMSAGRALYETYTNFEQPDLLIAHIGSIKKEEFRPIDMLKLVGDDNSKDKHEPDEWYYPNHLGLMGTLTVLDKLHPRVAIVSEFGAELKDIRETLINGLAQALHDKQTRDGKQKTPVFTGDITIIYNILTDMYLCHEDCTFHPAVDLKAREVDDWKITHNHLGSETCQPGNTKRVHLFVSQKNRDDHRRLEDYYKRMFKKERLYFTTSS